MNLVHPNAAFATRLLLHRERRRYTLRWLWSCRRDYLMRARVPWLVFGAIDFISTLDLAGRRVFEYGSGGSTLFWKARNANCVSVEHDPAWLETVRARLAASPATDYRLVRPEAGAAAAGPCDPADPDAYASADAGCSGVNFRRYASAIDTFPDAYFDIVLVDGRARPSCIKHAAPKVANGGYLILDNSDRPYYLERAGGYVRDFRPTGFTGPVPATPAIATTTIFQRLR